jgi:hypothetical protein
MKRLTLWSFALLVTVCFVLLTTGVAAAADVPFPTAGNFYYSVYTGPGTIPSGGSTTYMWTTGDYVLSSNFTGTGITSATGLSWNFQVTDILGGGNSETVDILLNNNVVGAYNVYSCDYCVANDTITGSSILAAIGPASGGYTLEMVLTNTIPGGGGSILFLDGGSFNISGGTSATPEPGTMLMFGTGVLGLLGAARRRFSV